ncbi:MAG: hypothetical protein LKE40_04040 [Spirochaetia bacterium]|jgi:hypothetical protein|nr:hypothetical protein [Spirochaetia bacterium]
MREVAINLLSGFIGAVIVYLFSLLHLRRQEWHLARENIFCRFASFYSEIGEMVSKPCKANHYTFQFVFEREKNFLKHEGKQFLCKKKMLNQISDAMENSYKEIVLKPDNERILLKDGETNTHYGDFISHIQLLISTAENQLIN